MGNNPAIKLRDVLFMVHAKPQDDAQAALWKRLADKTLTTPDTWETMISGHNVSSLTKKEAWEKVVDIWISDDE